MGGYNAHNRRQTHSINHQATLDTIMKKLIRGCINHDFIHRPVVAVAHGLVLHVVETIVRSYDRRPVKESDRVDNEDSGSCSCPSTTWPRFSRTSWETLRRRQGTLDVTDWYLIDVDRVHIVGLIVTHEHELASIP